MKLRIRDNSIRLRLTRSEVDTVNDDGLVSATVPFAGGVRFDYVLESSPACVKPVAQFSNNSLTVRLPQKEVRDWATSEAVSIASEQLLDDGGSLNILVEKDFACLAPREGEDESDMYPHPAEGEKTC
ncbi:MAG: hypothetical protein KJO31_02570 [Gammaproteobacteria bacterium]|nr:hypothetical protein [Gammaproteobacteria bacterium]